MLFFNKLSIVLAALAAIVFIVLAIYTGLTLDPVPIMNVGGIAILVEVAGIAVYEETYMRLYPIYKR